MSRGRINARAEGRPCQPQQEIEALHPVLYQYSSKYLLLHSAVEINALIINYNYIIFYNKLEGLEQYEGK